MCHENSESIFNWNGGWDGGMDVRHRAHPMARASSVRRVSADPGDDHRRSDLLAMVESLVRLK